MNERLSPEAERLVRAGRSGLSPSARDIDRMRARILAGVAAGAAAGVTGATAAAASTAGGAAAATGSAATAGAIGLVKVVVVVAAVTGASVTGGVLIARRGEPTPAASAPHRVGATHDTIRRAPPPPPIAVAPERDAGAVAAPDAGAALVPAPSRRPVADPPPSLAGEMDLLRRARAALKERDPRGALEHLDRHAARFPDSSLAPEAAAIRIQATCAVGDRETAQVLADQFQRRWPDSPLARRVPRLCGESP